MIEITSIPTEIKAGESFSINGKASTDQVGKTVNLTIDDQFKAPGSVVSQDGSWQIEIKILQTGKRSLEFSIDDESVESVILVIPANPRPTLISQRLSITPPTEEIKTENTFTLRGKAEGYDDGEELVLMADKKFELARPQIKGSKWEAPVLFHRAGKRLVEIIGSEQDRAQVELDVKPADSTIAILSRSVWTNRPLPADVANLTPKRITIHHTEMPTLRTDASQSDEVKRMRDIQSFQIRDRGFSDIAYHFLIMPSGRVYVGRPENKRGAHDIINDGLGIAFDGSFISNQITDAQFNSAVALCTLLCKRHGINDVVNSVRTPTADFGIKDLPRICGHRDRVNTDCPGTKQGTTVRLAEIRQEVQNRL